MIEEPRPGESLDRLNHEHRILQRVKGHRSGTDDVLAAWIGVRECPDAGRVLDLGCGHGTVTLLMSSMLPDARFVSVEVQSVSADLLRRNVQLNGLADRVEVVAGDLRELERPERYDLITGTPPFMPVGSGLMAQDPQRAAARFELRGGIEDYLATARRHLAPGGKVSMLMDASQDGRCVSAFADAGLSLYSVTVVTPTPGHRPRFRGYVGGLEARSGAADTLALCVREADGFYTPEMLSVRHTVGVEL